MEIEGRSVIQISEEMKVERDQMKVMIEGGGGE